MREFPKFTIERAETGPKTLLEEAIDELYTLALKEGRFEQILEDVIKFHENSDSPLSSFPKEVLEKIPAYHRLIKSGISTDEVSRFEGTVSPEKQEKIESIIQIFVDEKIEDLQLLEEARAVEEEKGGGSLGSVS